MSYIMSYVKGLICWVIITILIQLVIFYVKKHRHPNKTGFLKMVFIAYLIGVFSQTIFPSIDCGILSDTGKLYFDIYFRGGNQSNINFCPFKTIMEQLSGTNANINASDVFIYGVLNLAGNICLFIPIGFMLPGIHERFKSVRNALITCAGISIFVEIVQFLIGRSMDIDDVMLNELGALIGSMIWVLAKRKRKV